jgi:hypothetical protein
MSLDRYLRAQPGLIYGTVLVLSVIVGEARASPHEPARIAAVVGVTAVIFWLAHVYAHALGDSVSRQEHLSVAAVRRVAVREASLIEAALPPVAVLALGATGLIGADAAVWGAFAVGLLVLAEQGFAFARVERLGLSGTLVVLAANLGLGLALVALKLVVSH